MRFDHLLPLVITLALGTSVHAVIHHQRPTESTTPPAPPVPNVRPPPSQRKMNSSFIDRLITTTTSRMVDPDLATLFSNCFPNTLDTTVRPGWSSNDAFVITGDIDAMWLRDSTNQLLPYVPYANDAPELRGLIRGVVRRQHHSVLLDSYANAFNYNASGAGHPTDLRDPPMKPAVFEGKYELDSLCAVIKLTYHYWNTTNDTHVLIEDRVFMDAARRILNTITNMTMGDKEMFQANGDLPFYRFLRVNPWEYDAYPKGGPKVPTIGLIRSAFRPSDDATEYDFLIPSNAMAVVELAHLAELCHAAAYASGGNEELIFLSDAANQLAASVRQAFEHHAWYIPANETLPVLPYEIDGLGHVNAMDDPNIPSLLSIPLLGADFATQIAPGTRQWLLSARNPYFYCGTVGCGLGSPHTPNGWIWPMSLMVRALTSSNSSEVADQLRMLKEAARATGWMHESFNPSNTSQFTRPWFAWANTLFGQTILDVGRRFPKLIYKPDNAPM